MSGSNAKSLGIGFGSHIPSIEEKNKQIQQETMMEKLRAKHRIKPRTYDDIKKSVRMYFIEKHYPLDPLCKATLQSALDKLQHYIKVTSRHGLVERLESLSRQLGLKFMEDQQVLFISTDMFYVEILLDVAGSLLDVKVHHECKIDQQSSELVACLKAGDFADFTIQLEGLSSIYQLNAEPKVKKKAFVALQAMEADIHSLYQMYSQSHLGNSYDLMAISPVGLVLPRRGGHPMKLTYFCPPIHLPENDSKLPSGDFTIEQVIRSNHGLSVTVNLEGSSANKLQVLSTVTFTRDQQTGMEVPTYAPLNQNNSLLMPATYVLRLNKPMPVCVESLKALRLPGLDDLANPPTPATTVLNLIVQAASRQAIKNTHRGLYVNLPKETHCYFFTDNCRLLGTLVTSLPYKEPAQVPRIVAFLKKQSLFYTLLASCVREQQKQYNDMDSTVILEVTAVSFNQITVELQHPYEESLATVDFLLEDGQPTCSVYCLSNEYDLLSQKLTRTVRQVVSIPMVIYKLLKCWDEEHEFKVHGGIGPGSGAGTVGGGSVEGGGSVGGGSSGDGGGFHQFAMDTATPPEGNLPGAGFTNISNLKIDAKSRSLADAFAASTSAAAAIAGLINLKRETDPQPQAANSSGSCFSATASSSVVAKTNDQEIADKYKNIWKDKTPNLKHCVSITAIPVDGKSGSTSGGVPVADVQRTGGIEIIPLNAQTAVGGSGGVNSAAATTITITPITGKDPGKESTKKSSSASTGASVATKRPHESNSIGSSSGTSGTSGSTSSLTGSSSSADMQKEKKRKKKRDDSPMGPPEKIYSRQNSPAAGGDASTVGGVVRKFSSPSSSPKAGSAGQCLMAGVAPARPSPKHSPVYSSPKHNTASNSPKSPFGTHSPKHGSSGKPSMSTLKSAATAATSLSPKGEKTSSSVGASSGCASSAASGVGGATGLVRSFASVGAPPPPPPVPPLANTCGSGSQPIKKEKSASASSSGVVGSSGPGGGISPASVAAAVAALKSTQAQQQLKSSVASLSHLAAGGGLGSYASSAGTGGAAAAAVVGAGSGAGVSGLELSALRKGLTGGAVSLMTSTAALATTTPVTTTQSAATLATAGASLHPISLAGAGQAAPPPAATTIPSAVIAASVGTPTVTLTTATTAILQQPGAAPHSSCLATSIAGGTPAAALVSTEYMVKPSSQEGLKLTINKTGSGKSSSSSSSCIPSSSSGVVKAKNSSGTSISSASSTKKQHTGLKPGVNSGPASKKATAAASGALSSSKHLFQKANSSGNLSSKLSGPGNGGGIPLTKSNSTNSFQEHSAPKRRPSMGGLASGSGSSSSGQRKSSSSSAGAGGSSGGVSPAAQSGSMSQPPPRFDHHTDMMTILQYASPTMAASMEGFIKGLHNKFQIPKLSQRGNSGAACSGRNTPSGISESALSTSGATPSTSSGSGLPETEAKPTAQPPSTGGDLLLNLSSSSGLPSGEGIDEELLASLGGE